MARTGLTLDNYAEDMLLKLGSPILDIESKHQAEEVVEMAFNELKSYIADTETLTLPYSQVIDVSEYKINNVVYLMRGKNVSGPGGFQDIMYIYSRTAAFGTSYSLADYSRTLLAQQNRNALATDLDFHFDKRENKLYVYAQQPIPTHVTLVYTRDYEDVSEIIEPYWQNMLKRLSLAMMKEVLGRIRGKYNLNSATYSLDADKLLAESQAELAEIRTYLNNNSDLLLPID